MNLYFRLDAIPKGSKNASQAWNEYSAPGGPAGIGGFSEKDGYFEDFVLQEDILVFPRVEIHTHDVTG